jgi:hypothetical protein
LGDFPSRKELKMANELNGKRQRLMIQGVDFNIDSPYAEGYTLKSNEASAMNQLLAENVRNNLASVVRAAKLRAAGWTDQQIKEAKVEQMTPVADSTTLSEDQIAELQEQIDEYVSSYEFGIRTGRARSPFEKAVEDIVTEMLDKALKANGFSPSKMQKEERAKYDALYTRVLDANKEEVEAAAKARLDSLAGLSIKGFDVKAEAAKQAEEIAPPVEAAAE